MLSRRDFLIASTAAAATSTFAPSAGLAEGAEPGAPFDPAPRYVGIRSDFLPGEMLILPSFYYLYWVVAPGTALRYGVGVGRAGLEFTGTARIDVKKEWPTWRPTDDMILRSPETYARFRGNDYVQPGGPDNPLGARALYLFENGVDTYFRVHGTNEEQSIGRSVSNGCIRMTNSNVIDLYERVPIGTMVTVV
ncbi:L,D-transpeptidase [Pontibaca methylaminivorans]|uniref:L,D-transpeptidase n=1 Tax=Pontibaca methylaminivorans TaxID=515897 RepID=UPI002FDB4410